MTDNSWNKFEKFTEILRVLSALNWRCFSGAGLPRLSWKTNVVVVVLELERKHFYH